MRRARGFTLLELLLVLAVIGLIASLVVDVALDSRNRARKRDSASFKSQAEAVEVRDRHSYITLDDCTCTCRREASE